MIDRKSVERRRKGNLLVDKFPADVLQRRVLVATVHVERVLDFARLLESTDGEVRALLGGESVVPLNAHTTVPEKHAPAVERPNGFLRRLARRLLMPGHTFERFAGEEEDVLTPRVRQKYEKAFIDLR